ncbi:hypothetical protein LJR084_001187 [Variovorax sp. LjRoot84]|uniref:hypothetical protein n=1 Tax=Variovorax sp. LjRoot84 TaxID=3342340 RepID=UPI003ECE97C7
MKTLQAGQVMNRPVVVIQLNGFNSAAGLGRHNLGLRAGRPGRQPSPNLCAMQDEVDHIHYVSHRWLLRPAVRVGVSRAPFDTINAPSATKSNAHNHRYMSHDATSS